MYGYRCAHCGHLEILHTDAESLKHFSSSGYWPSLEHGEEPDQEMLASMHRKLRGYNHKRSNCLGFEYKKGISTEDLILLAMDHPSTLPYIDEDIRKEAVRRLEAIEDRRLADYPMPTGTMYLIQMGPYSVSLQGE
ncbi:MAG: hypothetical protein WC444_03275 [Candidatus Paceibacterota bacterium]